MKGTKRVHGDIEGDRISARESVFVLVRMIPSGRVMTYGQVASSLGSRLSPRAGSAWRPLAGFSWNAFATRTMRSPHIGSKEVWYAGRAAVSSRILCQENFVRVSTSAGGLCWTWPTL